MLAPLIFFLSLIFGEILQIVGYIGKSLVLCEVDEDPRSSLAFPVPADGAVAEVPAGRTLPVWVHESLPGVLAIPEGQTPPTELSSDPHTVAAPADGLHVDGLLPALVAGGPDGLVVNLVSESVTDFAEHVLSDVLGHQNTDIWVPGTKLAGVAFLNLLGFVHFVIV